MKYILAIFFLTIAIPAHAASIDRAIDVVFVQPDGETFTTDEQADALTKLKHAMAWWESVAPVPTALRVNRVYTDTEPAANDGNILITIIDNSTAHATLGGAQGMTITWYGTAYVYLTTSATEAKYAHELGHAAFGLPDFYAIPGACIGIDIMCLTEMQAYTAHFAGCATREALGVPCERMYLPIMEAP